jgi:menaquinone-dependent protoporphyrinogen oxidase
MKNILVAYATMAGSTAEVARAVGEELAKNNLHVDVLPLESVDGLTAYDAVVLGGPMIMGWHRAALKFLRQNREAFRKIPLAVFVMAMSLTGTGETSVNGVPVTVDEKLVKPPEKVGRLNHKERYANIPSYARPILKTVQPAKPVSIGMFGGRLEYGRLAWWAVLFAMLIIQAPAGDRRDWDAIRAWTRSLIPAFGAERG